MLVSVDAKKMSLNSLNTLFSNNSHWAEMKKKFLKVNKYNVITAVSFPNLSFSRLLPWWEDLS